MAPAPPSEAWLRDVRLALADFHRVFLGQVVPGDERYELVLTTRESPPRADLVEGLRGALGLLIGREDSPIAEEDAEGIRQATWHFFPAVDEREHELFERLDWKNAIIVHTRSD